MMRTWFTTRPARDQRRRFPGVLGPRAYLEPERLEDHVNPAPVPTVVMSPSTTALLGDTVPLMVTFSNTGNAPGYGPFVDVELPTVGNPATIDGTLTESFLAAPAPGTDLTDSLLWFAQQQSL